MIDDASREQELARPQPPAVGENHGKAGRFTDRVADLGVENLDRVVAREVFARETPELERRCAVAREKTVQRARRRIPRPAGVAHDDAAACAGEDERRAQARGPAADDDDITGCRAAQAVWGL